MDCISLQRNDLSGLRYLRAPPAAVATSVPPGSRMFCSCSGIHLFSSRIRPEVRDIVGLYLNPPDKAIVLSVDEKSQIQALAPAKPAASAQHRRPGSRATNGLRGSVAGSVPGGPPPVTRFTPPARLRWPAPDPRSDLPHLRCPPKCAPGPCSLPPPTAVRRSVAGGWWMPGE